MLQFIIGYLFFNPIRGETNSPSITSSSIPSTSLSTSASISSSSSVSNITEIIQTSSSLATVSNTPSPSCEYRIYNAVNDFSGTQGKNGWYYGYYNSGTFTQFTIYQTTVYTSYLAWNYNANSYGYISSTIIQPNGATSCSTPSYGNIAPVLRWINPYVSCYKDINIYLSLSPGTTNVLPSLTVNGNSLYSPSSGSVYSNYINAYDVSRIELSIGPKNGNCDAAQTTYSLIISPKDTSNTIIASISNTVSNRPSISPAKSNSNTNSNLKFIKY
jgi:hypothetical protein